MTPEQRELFRRIDARFSKLAYSKYAKGVEEHKDLLSSLDVVEILDHAIEEALDLPIYLITLRLKLEDSGDGLMNIDLRSILEKRIARKHPSTLTDKHPSTLDPKDNPATAKFYEGQE